MIAAGLLCAALAGAVSLSTAHYDLDLQGLDPGRIGSMLEQHYALLARFHGGGPSGRLRVVVVRTRADWLAALRREGTSDPGGGGYYSPGTRTAYLYLQPSAYYTRQLLLHETAHQFHWLATEGNRFRAPFWFDEGLAEYFGMHTWDGRTLVTGAVPAITLEDYPAQARKAAPRTPGELEDFVAGTRRPNRPESWALVRFLIERYPEGFRAMAAGLSAGAPALLCWRVAFGEDFGGMAAEFSRYVDGLVQPWEIVWISWQDLGGAIEGESDTNSLAVLKETPRELRVEVEPSSTPFKAGLVFGYLSPESFTLVQVVPGGSVLVVRRAAGKWERLATLDGRRAMRRNEMVLRMDGPKVRVSVNGEDAGVYEAPGRVGLNTDACRALFRRL